MPQTHAILNLLPEGSRLSTLQLAEQLGQSVPTIKRHLAALLEAGSITRIREGRHVRYEARPQRSPTNPLQVAEDTVAIPWSADSLSLRAHITRPLGVREPVTYQRSWIEAYRPNVTHWLPAELASALETEGRMQGRQPAGTYARKVLEPLLIDLSWSSSRLEGNRYSLLDTERLFETGMTDGDLDAVMLLNHKAAIEFLVDALPEYGLGPALLRNLHALLMQDLLADTDALGSIRNTVVDISGTTYVPTQVPSLLEEMFELIIDKAKQIKNPIEAAFFLWVNLAYLQPFEDGNKRTSRLAANIPLMLYNCAPLSFLDIEPQDYALAMLGVYERCDLSMVVDLFTWVYRRSIRKYGVMLDAMGVPDPVRLRYRELLNEAIGLVVREGRPAVQVAASLSLSESERALFDPLLKQELQVLAPHNCARYRLSLRQVQAWVDAGRPV